MRKVKLIVHETYQGKRKTEDVFAAAWDKGTVLLSPNPKEPVRTAPIPPAMYTTVPTS